MKVTKILDLSGDVSQKAPRICNSILIGKMYAKLSVIGFKPKPEYFDVLVANPTTFNESKHRILFDTIGR